SNQDGIACPIQSGIDPKDSLPFQILFHTHMRSCHPWHPFAIELLGNAKTQPSSTRTYERSRRLIVMLSWISFPACILTFAQTSGLTFSSVHGFRNEFYSTRSGKASTTLSVSFSSR